MSPHAATYDEALQAFLFDLDELAADGFGHWLAGFIDGEGSFLIGQRRHGRGGMRYACRLTIGLRADELPILETIRDRLGVGWITGLRGAPGANPQRIWLTVSKPDCVAMVALLDRFPLRAKKARDFVIWREAVAEWMRVVHTGGPTARCHDWTRMGELKLALEQGRRYEAGDVVPPVRTDQQILS